MDVKAFSSDDRSEILDQIMLEHDQLPPRVLVAALLDIMLERSMELIYMGKIEWVVSDIRMAVELKAQAAEGGGEASE